MWRLENRSGYDRRQLRYPSDLTNEEWTPIGPLIPPAKRGGNKRMVAERDVVNGVQGPKFQQGLLCACDQINLEIVKRSELHKFVLLPKRWIVERTIGWLNRCRRLAKD